MLLGCKESVVLNWISPDQIYSFLTSFPSFYTHRQLKKSTDIEITIILRLTCLMRTWTNFDIITDRVRSTRDRCLHAHGGRELRGQSMNHMIPLGQLNRCPTPFLAPGRWPFSWKNGQEGPVEGGRTPLLVEKAGVAPDMTFRITACKQERVQARYPLWIWNPWGRTHEVPKQEQSVAPQNGPWSRQKIFKKKKKRMKDSPPIGPLQGRSGLVWSASLDEGRRPYSVLSRNVNGRLSCIGHSYLDVYGFPKFQWPQWVRKESRSCGL